MIVFKFMANAAIWIVIASIFATTGQKEQLVSLQIRNSDNRSVSLPAFASFLFSDKVVVKSVNCSYRPNFLHHRFLAAIYNPAPGSRLGPGLKLRLSLTVTDIFRTGMFTGVIIVN